VAADSSHIEPSSDDDSSFRFDISLPFQVPECPSCGGLVKGKVCECGVPAPEVEPDQHALARQRALQTARQRAEALLASFDGLSSGRVPLTPDQFALALHETDLVTKVGDSYKLGSSLSELDLCKPKVVGTEVRRAIESHLDRTEGLLAACQELAAFRPQPPGDELQLLAVETGRYGAELAVSLIQTLTAADYAEALGARDRVEKLWNSFPLGDRLSTALKRLDPWRVPDPNARVALALGREGHYVNESGELDPALVFLAFAGEDDPAAALAEAAWRYIEPHTKLTAPMDPAGSGVIAAPLVMLAASERPLRAHRTTRLMFETAETAFGKDPDAVKELARRVTDEGASIFAALSRITRAFQGLKEDSSDEDAVDGILRSYRQIAETSYRTVGWLALGLESIADERGLPPETQPPMLGPLQQRLTAGGPLAKTLADGIDVELRNAEAHVQYRWVAERQVVRDFRTGQEWGVGELEAAIHELTGAITGADAGYACFVMSSDLCGEIPAWLHDGLAPEVPGLLAGMTFGARGFDVVRVEDDGATVVIASPPDLNRADLLPPLAGLIPFAGEAATFRIRDAEGATLAEVSAEMLRRSVGGPELFKDLAVIAVAYESAARTGMDAAHAGREFIALINKVVAVTGLQGLVEMELAPSAFRNLNERLGYVLSLSRSTLALEMPDPAQQAKRIGRVRAALAKASKGNQAALESLTTQLVNLAREADEIGALWPPKALS
jgi:hypothetical protein